MSRISALERQRNAATRTLSEALAQIRRLKKDKARLDFLQKNPQTVVAFGGFRVGRNDYRDTLRQAIDVAIRADRKSRGFM